MELNTSQMARGRDKNNASIELDGKPFYTPYTMELKNKFGSGIGKITSWVTLYQSGAMYRSMSLSVNNASIDVQFNTAYSTSIVERTGETIFGLNSDNRQEYIRSYFLDVLRHKVVNIMKIEFV